MRKTYTFDTGNYSKNLPIFGKKIKLLSEFFSVIPALKLPNRQVAGLSCIILILKSGVLRNILSLLNLRCFPEIN